MRRSISRRFTALRIPIALSGVLALGLVPLMAPPVAAAPMPGLFMSVSTGDAAGSNYSCALRTTRAITCWGDNSYGQLQAPHGSYLEMSVGGTNGCAVGTDHHISCWGSRASGVASPPAGTFTQVSVGDSHACGLRSDATVACWGRQYVREGVATRWSVPIGERGRLPQLWHKDDWLDRLLGSA